MTKRIAALDPDVHVDLAGEGAARDALLSHRPARLIVTVVGAAAPEVLPRVDFVQVSAETLSGFHVERQREIGFADEAPDAAAMMAMWDGAVRAHQRGETSVARDGYERVLAVQPGHAPAHYLLGIVLRDSGDATGARAQFERAVAAAPRFADAWRAAANAALAAGDGATAADAFERVLGVVPGDASTHYNHGVALQIEWRAEDAMRAYERALALDPDFASARFNLAALLQETGRAEAAIDAFKRVLQAEPANATAYKNLGEVLFAAGRFDAWFENFHRFEARCPDALPLAVQGRALCLLRQESAAQEQQLIATLGATRFGEDVLIIVDLPHDFPKKA